MLYVKKVSIIIECFSFLRHSKSSWFTVGPSEYWAIYVVRFANGSPTMWPVENWTLKSLLFRWNPNFGMRMNHRYLFVYIRINLPPWDVRYEMTHHFFRQLRRVMPDWSCNEILKLSNRNWSSSHNFVIRYKGDLNTRLVRFSYSQKGATTLRSHPEATLKSQSFKRNLRKVAT